MESIYTGNNQPVYQCEDHGLLFDTLRLIWHNYVQEGSMGDMDVKQHWLQLFLYNFQYVSDELLFNDDFRSFFNPIPEEMCSFLLEQVYETISKSDLFSNSLIGDTHTQSHGSDSIKNKQDLAQGNSKQVHRITKKNHNFAQLILKQPSDCSKIVALREFLTHHLGQHILQFLLKVDVKLIASQTSLCNLCINLFPTCRWSEDQPLLQPMSCIFDFVGNLQMHHKTKSKPTASEFFKPPKVPKLTVHAMAESSVECYQQFLANTKTSDEIALILIQLLTKCMEYKSYGLQMDHAVLMLTLNFGLDSLRLHNNAFSCLHNAEIIKGHLLKLNETCLNNLFGQTDHSLNDIQFQYIFAKLIAALENNSETPRILYALIYLIFGILYNVVGTYLQKTLWNSNANLYNLKFIDESLIGACLSTMDDLLRNHPPNEADLSALFHLTFRGLLKIIENLKRCDILITSPSANSSHSTLNNNRNFAKSAFSRQRKIKAVQTHCLTSLPRLSCYFQNILITLLPILPKELLEQSMLYLAKSGLCCCHYKLSLLNTILGIIQQVTTYSQKCAYKFLYCKLISTIFLRCSFELPGKKPCSNSCTNCDMKLRSPEFHEGLLLIYKSFYAKITQSTEEDLMNLLLFLKHLKHLSHLLTNDIAAGVVAEIVLPVFRKYKAALYALRQRSNPNSPQHALKFWQRTNSVCKDEQQHQPKHPELHLSIKPHAALKEDMTKLLNDCLNIFSMYLGDIRLIKAFYNEENISHLEELLDEPLLIRGVCDLIRIGIDNITFLGETSLEQAILSRRLITLQFNSSERAQQLFNGLIQKLRRRRPHLRSHGFWVDCTATVKKLNETQLNCEDVLQIVALQWSLNYELLKTSQCFYNEFAKIYSISHEDETDLDESQKEEEEEILAHSDAKKSTATLKPGDKTIVDILQLNYNALTAFLMVAPRGRRTKPQANSEIDSSWELIENFIDSMLNSSSTEASARTSTMLTASQQYNDEPMLFSFNSEPETLTSLLTICEYQEAEPPYLSFLERLQNKQLESLDEGEVDESICLFDIRQQKNFARHEQQQPGNRARVSPIALKDYDALSSNTQGDTSFINRLFGIVGSIFTGRGHSLLDLHNSQQSLTEEEADIEDDLLPLLEAHGECKKLLLKLFEATMAICVKGYQNEEEEKMQKHLRKLKSIILASASSNWEQHVEENTRENSVLQTLQCLLKIAELSNTSHEPAAVVSTSVLTTGTDDHTQCLELGARRRSCNYGRGTGCLPHTHQQLGTALPSKNALMTPTTPPHRRPLSGESEVDYFSTRTSIVCPDSELELSENEQEDFYLTADEGYEADAEIQDQSEAERISEMGEIWHSFQPSSRYRAHVLHEGICRLVVEIVIELSQKCCQNPEGWSEHLAQLVNRLFVIRECLGGATFLLKGFSPILKCNDARLRELQQSILELIVDFNAPEILTTFFGILASKSPPMEILVKYMHHICINTLRKCQASVELEFPMSIEEFCVTACDTDMALAIDHKRSYQLKRKMSTALTRAPCILPISQARLWTRDGFTVSLWLQAKAAQNQKSISQIIDDDTRSSSDIYKKTHIFSIGTNQAMLSVYLNNNHQLIFETFKPNAESTRNVPIPADDFHEARNSMDPYAAQSPEVKRNKRTEINGNGNRPQAPDSVNIEMNVFAPKNNSASPLTKAFKQTKNVILNSFSNIHLFNGHAESPEYFECSHVDLKPFRMTKNKWTHFMIAVEMLNDCLDLCIHIDGVERHRLSLAFPNVRMLTREHSFQAIVLGDSVATRSPNNTSCSDSHSTLDGYPMRFAVTNMILFKRSITLTEVILNLTAMGPDFSELTQCQMANWKPNYGYLNLNKLQSAYFCNLVDSMKTLRESRILSYSASQPDVVMSFDTSVELDNVTFGHPYNILQYAHLTKSEILSIQTSTILSGGLSNLLYLFARVVEISVCPLTQSLALDLLLTVAFSESQLFTEFQRNDYVSLIGYVIKTERCSKDCQLLRSIMNNACSQPLILRRGDALQVNETTVATVVYPKLLISIIHRYSDWHRSGAKNSDVLDMLFQCILALTREKHPQRDFNVEQFNKENLMRELLNLFKVYLIESPNPVFISKKAAASFVAIISVFSGSPPKPYLLDEIMKLLLLLHKPNECYITHDRSKFYFLLTPDAPAKEKSSRISGSHFDRVTAPFKRNITKRNHPGVAKPLNTRNNEFELNTDGSDADAARQARINRLRKMHRPTSEYKKSLIDFEDNLENIADCSKLNKNALRLIDPAETFNWRTKLKRRISQSWGSTAGQVSSPQKVRLKPPNKWKSSPSQKIQRRRKRLISGTCLRSQTSPDGKRRRAGSDPPSPDSPFHLLDINDCPGWRSKLKSNTRADGYSMLGIHTLQSGLLLLLKDFLCLLPDNDIDDVLHHYIKIEFLLVLANHQSFNVRSAVIKLVSSLTQRLFPQDIQVCIKAYYPHHLANQLTIGACDGSMFESCLEWVCGTIGSVQSILQRDTALCIKQCFGLNALLAIAAKSVATVSCQIDVSEKAFIVLRKLYLGEQEDQQRMIEAGLVQCCVKGLFYLYSRSTPYNTKTEEAIANTLTTIGQLSLQSLGHISVIWDIINVLSFYQERQPQNIVKNFRSIQAKIQLCWMNSFFAKTNVPWSFKVQEFPQLSMSETKTRLELLLNRCSQFFMVFNEKSTPSINEIELFQTMVSYSIASNQRCNNFIAWGLQPSQPRDLRCFIVDALWISCQDEFLPAIICDGKMIKALLWLSLLEDLDEPICHLQGLCERLGINENDSTWNLESELQRMDLQKTSDVAKQKTWLEKTIYRFEPLALGCIESSMMATRRVAELQNSERKLLMHHMKDYDDTQCYTKWLEIVRRMTHEGAPWFAEHNSERFWELDPTEGPCRVHTRLKRCHLDLHERFFMKDYGSFDNNGKGVGAPVRPEYSRPLDYLISSYDQQLNISLNSQILYNFPAKFLPVDGEIDGEIIVTDHKLYFLATHHCKYFYINCDISNITEIWLKRYQHQEKAFEIFLDSNQSLFFSLQNQADWKIMREVFCDKIVAPPDQSKVLLITQQWREGQLTNWEYLMTLNQIAGRTYNDLMQYPVFPWILNNYTSDMLDLTEAKNFRKLVKPIAVQSEENEQHYINNYTYIQNTVTNMGSLTLKPYHYSSHYSNSGTVLHFLVRVPPFTSYFLHYQDDNFDLPDRTFHALHTTFSLASRDSTTDVKELIPEFFCLPELFENFDHFNFGCRQNGDRVEDVLLPPWCLKDPRLFILIHRQALESETVRNNLHSWIDLIFGYKQTGEAAVEAINVFHPATYAVFLESEINDPLEREAVETMVRTYGQMPRQLFKAPHPSSKVLSYQSDKQILPSVRGLRWGAYVGSPQLQDPTLGNTHKLSGAEYLLSFNNTNVVYGLPARSCVMQGAETDTYNVISWGYDDRIVRIQPLNKLHAKPKNLLYNSTFDDITACGCDPNSNQLWFGHKSGRISIYKCFSMEAHLRTGKSRHSYVKDLKFSYNSAFRKIISKAVDSEPDMSASAMSSNSLSASDTNLHKDGADLMWMGPTVLVRHTDEITYITLSVEFKIAVTAGKDGIAVIWDLNDWTYVRTIERPAEIHHSPITLVAISHTLGDIVTVHSLSQQQQQQPDAASTNSLAYAAAPVADECFEVTEENLDDFVNVCINPNGKSILRLHSVNARYVQHFIHEDRITAVCYSYIKEGVGINVIATAVEGGIVRLWSSWNLSFITEIITGTSDIRSLTYSTHQHLVVLTENSHIQVWESKGLYGNSPKFPQIAYK